VKRAGDLEECACVGCDDIAPAASADVRGFCPKCEGRGCSFADGPKCGESWDRDPTDGETSFGGIPVARVDAAAHRAFARAAATLAPAESVTDVATAAVLAQVEDLDPADRVRVLTRALAQARIDADADAARATRERNARLPPYGARS